jgi:hypothetical protein
MLGLAGAFAIAFAVGTVAIGAALSARADADARLARLEAELEQRNHALAARTRSLAEGAALENSGMVDHDLDHVLADLAWVAASKTDETRLLTWYWDHGYMALEVRSEAAPFVAPDRMVKRSARPVRRGVWLYGVAPANAVSAANPPAPPQGAP